MLYILWVKKGVAGPGACHKACGLGGWLFDEAII
jgi:hypothetical protein